MIYGYLRVSSDKQDINSQRIGVENFAKKNKWEINEFITDEGVSGGADPKKRNLGPLLSNLKKGDKIIASEISRLGRDLYMVMDILHHCMKTGCIVYTVKDNFILGNDIQSKVLSFAFGLAAEIERQMIQQRTKEGLRRRVYAGVLLGRPFKCEDSISVNNVVSENIEEILIAIRYGASQRNVANKLGIDRNTFVRSLMAAGYNTDGSKMSELDKSKFRQQIKEYRKKHRCAYKFNSTDYEIVELPGERIEKFIIDNLTIPEIHEKLGPKYTYEQVYDTILNNYKWNRLYRSHGQKICKRKKI